MSPAVTVFSQFSVLTLTMALATFPFPFFFPCRGNKLKRKLDWQKCKQNRARALEINVIDELTEWVNESWPCRQWQQPPLLHKFPYWAPPQWETRTWRACKVRALFVFQLNCTASRQLVGGKFFRSVRRAVGWVRFGWGCLDGFPPIWFFIISYGLMWLLLKCLRAICWQ